MKRKTRSGPRSSSKKIAKKDVILVALEKFRSGMNSSVFKEPPSENQINHVAEMEKKKIIKEFMPIIMKSTGEEVYDLVVELEVGIQKVIQEFLKAPEDVDSHAHQGQHGGQSDEGSNLEDGNATLLTIIKAENDIDMTITSEWSSTASPEQEDKIEDQNQICIVQVRGEEDKKLEKLESLVLNFSKDIRYHKNGFIGRVPTIGRSPESGRVYWRPVQLTELQSNITNLKVFLKSGELWPEEYRKIHKRLVKVRKFVSSALNFALCRPPNSLCLMDEDCSIWCMASDLDISECLPSQGESPEFQVDKDKYEETFFKHFFGYLIDSQWISKEWKKDKDRLTPWLLDMIKSQIISREMEDRPRAEALYKLWKLRNNSA